MAVHPQVAERFSILEGVESMEQLGTDPALADKLKEWLTWPNASTPPVVATVDLTAPGPHGPVPVRVYGGRSAGAGRPCLVWYHGGGFVSGDLDMPEADWTAREIAERADAVVVSVDYRLAQNGVCYPIPLDDCTAAARWVLENASELGVDRTRIFLGGGSAGANLATGATLRMRDKDGWQPAGLIPVYGLFHPRLPSAPSTTIRLLDSVPAILRFPPEVVAGLNDNYLGGPPSSSDGYAMPALANLEGLCPVFLINSEYDRLRISGEAFAAALALAGVDVRQVKARGMLHAFLNLPASVGPVSDALDLMASIVSGTGAPSGH